MLKIENLVSGYGRIEIIRDITLSASTEEVVGILGHNGVGKTTLAKTIVGSLPIIAGSVRMGQVDLSTLPAYKRTRAGIGYVPQGRHLFPGLSVDENIVYSGVAVGRNRRETRDAMVMLFPRLERLLSRKAGNLSGGEQQLVALARALGGSPRVLLLDEPTEGIQPSIIKEMIEVLRDLRKASDLVLVVVEQNVEFLRALADRIVIVERGAIVREGRCEEVLNSWSLS